MNKGKTNAMIQEITRIPLEGVHNTRDLGGYRTIDGRGIKPHCLIRSGELSKLTEKDKEILPEEYKLSAVVDFRTGAEQRENPDPVLEGVTYISNPILEEQALGITREKKVDKDVVGMVLQEMKGNENAGSEYMESMYENLVTNAFCRKQYAGFFSILLNQESGSVLWHCTAGKDRVGRGTGNRQRRNKYFETKVFNIKIKRKCERAGRQNGGIYGKIKSILYQYADFFFRESPAEIRTSD